MPRNPRHQSSQSRPGVLLGVAPTIVTTTKSRKSLHHRPNICIYPVTHTQPGLLRVQNW